MLRTGHMLRLPETTPVRLALKDTNINRKKHRGTGNKMTWKKLINRDLSNVDKSLSLESESESESCLPITTNRKL
jgi:hypothetical protein